MKRSSRPEGTLLPPRRFVPVGPVEWAMPSSQEPAFVRNSTKQVKGNMRKGLKYEQRFSENMLERFDDYYVPGPWFHYKEIGKERTRWCQPDGLLFIPEQSRIILYEVKLKHTSDAWWQLRFLYLPVLSRMFPPDKWSYVLMEITHWYDPHIAFPERVRMCPDVLSAEPGEFGVHIWIPR